MHETSNLQYHLTTTDQVELSHQRLQASSDVSKLFPALVAAQSEIPAIHRDKANPFFKSQYAPLESVIRICKPILAKHGIGVIQFPTGKGAEVEITTLVFHTSGQYILSSFIAQAKAGDPQSVGSCITYLRRYAYLASIGVATEDEDDDGNEASQPQAPNPSLEQMLQSLEALGVTKAMLKARFSKQPSVGELFSLYRDIKSGRKKVSDVFEATAADQLNKQLGVG
jgi:hypothetical protein